MKINPLSPMRLKNYRRSLLPLLLLFLLPLYASSIKKKTISILFLGDSLTEGIRVQSNKNFPALLNQKLNKKGVPTKIINAGLSGNTTLGGLKRFPWYLQYAEKPDFLFLALGANDGLRGTPIKTIQNNLAKIIQKAQKYHIKVVLAGMQLPPNYGEKQRSKFAQIFPALARKYKTHFFPFLLENVAGESALNQIDGIHPNEKGYQIISDNLLDFFLPILLPKSKK